MSLLECGDTKAGHGRSSRPRRSPEEAPRPERAGERAARGGEPLFSAGEGVSVHSQRAVELSRTALANGHPEARKALRLLGETAER